ncbi:MAG TPA: RibD family protein [Polyangiaceae bacterium]|jgi:5-amino-6-(5-phosphoribosylamino)uracil reductase/diaminohydroxyphosphoribosylaminopyrimidine deaminase/5-amino-6-(5-phosphoribosylamino)uracil reductase
MTVPERPKTTLHFAQSLDGRIGLPGVRTPLSSHEGVLLAHRARAEHDAVLVGRATVTVDDPRLAAVGHEGRQPKRVVLASTLDVRVGARVLQGGPGTLVVGVEGRASAAAQARLEAEGATVKLVAADDGGLVSLPAALAAIRAWGVERLLVEGGARVLSAFLRGRLADEATVEIAPRLLGAPAVAAVGEVGVVRIEHAITIDEPTVERAGASVVVRGRLVY